MFDGVEKSVREDMEGKAGGNQGHITTGLSPGHLNKCVEGCTEEGALELDLDAWVDFREEMLCAKVEKRREMI